MELAGGEGTGGVGTGGSRKSPRTPTRRRTGLAGGVRGVTKAFSSVRLSAERFKRGKGRERDRGSLGSVCTRLTGRLRTRSPRAGGGPAAVTGWVPRQLREQGAGDEQQPQMFPRRERWASRWEIKPGPRKDRASKGAAGLGRNLGARPVSSACRDLSGPGSSASPAALAATKMCHRSYTRIRSGNLGGKICSGEHELSDCK